MFNLKEYMQIILYFGSCTGFEKDFEEIQETPHFFPKAICSQKEQLEFGRTIHTLEQELVQIITNSEHILNGVRLAVVDGNLKPEQILIKFIDSFKRVHEITVKENCELSNYPNEFMDTEKNALRELLKFKIRKNIC